MGLTVFVRDSQHTQSLKATEHPASNRVDLIGREVKLIDRWRTFKCSIFNLRDLIVAQVTVCGERGGGRNKRNVRQLKAALTL